MKKYTKPEIEISVFATEDVITTSGDVSGGTSASLTHITTPLSDTTTGVDYNDIF